MKVQLVCNVRPLTADVPGGHLALKTREGMFNLAPAVLVGSDLDLAVRIQNRGVKAIRGWTITVGVDFSVLSGASIALLDLRGPQSLRIT